MTASREHERSAPRGRALRVCALLLAAGVATGCQYGAYYFRSTNEPMLALEVRMDPHVRRRCLVVMMPGMLNVPDSYLEHGFVADAAAASRRCDILLVDAHYGYYLRGTVAARFGEDVLTIADARGYEDIWLVGSSMGAMGAMRVARAYPDRIAGVVLFGPWFGDERVVRSIEEAGGLARWRGEGAEPSRGDPGPEALWAWMRGYATHPDAMPPLFIAVGATDGMRAGAELLGAHLPSSHFGVAPGGHQWAGWRVMWRRLLASPPWDPGAGVPRIDR